ncbi:hypothetical protein [Streptomyces sp. NPDC088915]|uniref:hypothetical protein n=1 Tax=Streptomyces sp. NPDC088915 TaxID=3365912 RepID=UPI00380D4089
MYLIHARLRAKGEVSLPERFEEEICRQEVEPASIEHVVLHDDLPGIPVLGLFVAARNLVEAERAAETACLRVLMPEGLAASWELVTCEAAFVAEFYKRLLAGPQCP